MLQFLSFLNFYTEKIVTYLNYKTNLLAYSSDSDVSRELGFMTLKKIDFHADYENVYFLGSQCTQNHKV